MGLFGYLGGGTVRGVILTDARIYGLAEFGGLVGCNDGTVSDCYLYHVFVVAKHYSGNYNQGVIIGTLGSNGSVVRSYFRDCVLRQRGQFINPLSGDATIMLVDSDETSVFKLTPDASVVLPVRTGGTAVGTAMTSYDNGFTLDGTQYYTTGAALTLSYNGTVPQGYRPCFTAVSGSQDKTAEVINGSTLTMRDYDVSVSCEVLPIPSETTWSLTARRASYAGQTLYWATFYHPSGNYLLPAGAQAFTMGADHALYRVGDGSVIPVGCAVVVLAEPVSTEASIGITLTKTERTATPAEGNILHGEYTKTATATLVTGSQKVYVMGAPDGTLGFFPFTGTKLPANKAYYIE